MVGTPVKIDFDFFAFLPTINLPMKVYQRIFHFMQDLIGKYDLSKIGVLVFLCNNADFAT